MNARPFHIRALIALIIVMAALPQGAVGQEAVRRPSEPSPGATTAQNYCEADHPTAQLFIRQLFGDTAMKAHMATRGVQGIDLSNIRVLRTPTDLFRTVMR